MIDRGKYDQAERMITAELEAGHERFAAYLALGYLESRRGRTFASVRAYRHAEDLGPDNAEVHSLLAEDYFLLNQRALFEEEIRESLRVDPRDARAHYLAGRFAYEVQSNFDIAAKALQTAIELKPEDYKAHCYLALCYEALNKGELARRELEQACRLVERQQAKYDLPFRTLAKLCLDQNESNLGLEYSRKAIAINPASSEAQYLAGKAEFELGRFDDAIKSLNTAAALDPTYADPSYLLGRLYQRIGRPVLSQQAFARFKEIRKEYGSD